MTSPTSKIRLVFVINSLHSGGAEKQLLWAAKTLAGDGIPCAVFELQAKPGNIRLENLIQEAAMAGVEIHRLGHGEAYFHAWREFRRFLRDHPAAVVWSWGYRADGFVLSHLWLRRRPWLSALRFASPEYVRRGRWLTWLCRDRITRYVANTWANCEMLEKECPPVMAKCRVIYNAVEELAREPVMLPAELPRPFRVLMLGNIDPPRKGYDYALDLAERLCRERRPLEIHISGRADSGGWLPGEIIRRRLTGQVFYHGEAGNPLEFLRTGHAYLLTSRIEGMPNSLLEAMSVGLPSVASKVGDLDRMTVDGEQLRLTPIGGIAEAHQALVSMMEDWPAAVAMGRRGRAWCRVNFDGTVSRQQLLQVVEEVLPRD